MTAAINLALEAADWQRQLVEGHTAVVETEMGQLTLDFDSPTRTLTVCGEFEVPDGALFCLFGPKGRGSRGLIGAHVFAEGSAKVTLQDDFVLADFLDTNLWLGIPHRQETCLVSS